MKNNESCCIGRLLKVIEVLQNNSSSNNACEEGCSKPFLGPTISQTTYNTRPVNLYTSDGNMLSVNYNNDANKSNVFRVECVNGCCARLRILAQNLAKDTSYTSTNEFITVNIKNISAVSCLNDIELNI